MRMARSVARATSGSSGSAGQTLWASSITIRTGRRSVRWRWREDLAKTRDADTGVQHGVAADLQLQAVQRGLEGEAAPVDRGGEREHRRLDVPAYRTETV